MDTDPQERTDAQTKQLRDYFVEYFDSKTRSVFDPLHGELEAAKNQRDEFEKSIPGTLIMEDMTTLRETYVLKRGEYDRPDKSQKVIPNVPAVLPPLPKGVPSNRPTLARWLVDPAHPLTVRVTVNRLWQQVFGTGIGKTAEDFGAQGEWPSHPKLLDWLACEFIASRWDVRFVQILIRGWDQHNNLPRDIRNQCHDVDQGGAALIQDLKQRGLLDDILVVWGGEFGRLSPFSKLTGE